MYYSKIYIWYTGELTLYQGRPQCSVAGYSLGQKRERMAIKDAVVEEEKTTTATCDWIPVRMDNTKATSIVFV